MLKVIVVPSAWESGISWLIDPPQGGSWLRRRLWAVAQLKGELATVEDPRALLSRSSSLAWLKTQELASQRPLAWQGISRTMVANAACGLRYVELVTGRDIPCSWPFPVWLRDWTSIEVDV